MLYKPPTQHYTPVQLRPIPKVSFLGLALRCSSVYLSARPAGLVVLTLYYTPSFLPDIVYTYLPSCLPAPSRDIPCSPFAPHKDQKGRRTRFASDIIIIPTSTSIAAVPRTLVIAGRIDILVFVLVTMAHVQYGRNRRLQRREDVPGLGGAGV